MKAPEQLETARLKLRQPTNDDVAAIFEYASDADVTTYLVWKRLTNPQQVQEHLDKCHANWLKGSEFTWFLADAATNRVVGSIAVRIRGSEAEMGFVLNRACWGRGLMTEAALAVIHWLNSIAMIEQISATCDAGNYRSARVLEKIGLMRQGVLPAGMIRPNISDQPRETYVFAKKTTAV